MNNDTNNKVLIIVAHTDDETLGLGATIAKHVSNGDKVYALSMTNGIGARENVKQEEIDIRAKAAYEASNVLGFKWLKGGNFPDNAMDSVPVLNIIKFIEEAKKEIEPYLIYTHSSADLNIDHRVVNQATFTAFRPQDKEIWQEIRTFEVPSSTDYGHKSITNSFSPNLYINISEWWNKKLCALQIYSNEIRKSPHSRSIAGIENLAKYRGNQVGLSYAEAFEIIRKIER
ncbi:MULTISPECIES: PIG-L deacetylase family protein [Prochlorococcus]|uniref:PIG-L deacetylase family protein n=1 Tax=Prochlorococcus TaxID=1218 RepID=UPI0005336FDD|nr:MULTISPECIES: PIG-L family deacetylase [Prochlorococcus]KGG12094.1 putative LmbE-like protein [Prochlorococcus sp. MIT 0601]